MRLVVFNGGGVGLPSRSQEIDPIWKDATNKGVSRDKLVKEGVAALANMANGASYIDATGSHLLDSAVTLGDIAHGARVCRCYIELLNGNAYNPFSICYWQIPFFWNVGEQWLEESCAGFLGGYVHDWKELFRTSEASLDDSGLDPVYLDIVKGDETLHRFLVALGGE